MPYDEGHWRILPLESTERLGVPVLDASCDDASTGASVQPAYVLAHVPTLNPDAGPAQYLQVSEADEDGIDLVLGDDRLLAARVGFRSHPPIELDEPDDLPFPSVERCETAIFVEGRGWLACRPRRAGICLGWAKEPHFEWALQCLHPAAGADTVATGADVRLWNREAADFLVFDTGELGPAPRWLTDYQRLQRVLVGAAQETFA